MFDPNCSKHQLFLGEGEFNTWKVLCHAAWNTEQLMESKIFGHNFIRLHHAETDSYLYAGQSFEGKHPEIALKRYYGGSSEEAKSVHLYDSG